MRDISQPRPIRNLLAGRTGRWLRPWQGWSILICLAGCFEKTPTSQYDVQGVVTSSATGLPVEGARVFLEFADCAFVSDNLFGLCKGASYSGQPLLVDTVVTDGNGRYHMSTRYYCPASVGVKADGYQLFFGPDMPCGLVPTVLDPALTPDVGVE